MVARVVWNDKKYQVQAISITTSHYLWLHCNTGCFNCDYLKSVKV